MDAYKVSKTKTGKTLHYTVAALIERDGIYLLMDRKKPPLGFAGPAGHVDEGEEPQEALVREVSEETGLDVVNCKLLFEELVPWNWCNKNKNAQHYWWLYGCKAKGDAFLAAPEEGKSIDWYSPEEIKKLELEEAWEYWFKKLGIV